MKSKRKIFSLLFLIIFLVSNTGLPLTMHLCQMMDQVSIDSCSMCSKDVHKKSCCSDNPQVTISKVSQDCCLTKIAAEPIKDRFIPAKEDNKNFISFALAVDIPAEALESFSSQNHNYTDFPPLLYEKEIFLLNSTLLI
jgi:hypothetical protein